jgi:hypothetical protein
MFLRRVAWVALFVGAVACGGKPPAAAGVAKAPDSAEQAEAAPDLSPVSAPADLVAVGRVVKPRALIETFMKWGGVPVGLTQLLPPDLRELEELVQWDAPFEFAAALDRETASKTAPPRMVVSFGLVSVDSALAFVEKKGGRATRTSPGVYRVEIQKAVCAIAVSLGNSPARLVCSDDWQDVEPLLAYATRGLPREALGSSDVFLEIRLRPVERRYREQIQSLRVLAGLALRQIETDDPRLDRALSDVVYGLADELGLLSSELDRLTLTASLDTASKWVELDYALTLNGTQSTLGQILRETGKRAAPPPEVFYRLPAEAQSGGYAVGTERTRFAKLASYLTELLDAYLAREKLPARFRERVRSAAERLPQVYGGSAYASGGAAASKAASPGERLVANVGWHVGVVEQEIDGLTRLFGDLTAALNDKEFSHWLVNKHKLDRALIPKAKSAGVRVPTFTAAGTAYTIELPPKLAARILDVTESPAPAPDAKSKPAKEKPVPISLVLAPDGGVTWIAVAGTQRAAVDRLAQAHGNTGPTLAGIPALAQLKAKPSVSGGFTTVESMSRMVSDVLAEKGVDLNAALTKVPEHGRTPILWWGEAGERGPETFFGGRLRVPAAAIGDAGALILQSVGRNSR